MAVIAGYSGAIALEGGSIMNFGSGASLAFAQGAQLGGTIGGTPTFAERVTLTTGLTQSAGGATCIASSALKLAHDIAASGTAGIFEIVDFGNGIKFFLSKSPNNASAAGSPGSLLLHLAGGVGGSGARLYIKVGDNSPASAGWVKLRLDLASS